MLSVFEQLIKDVQQMHIGMKQAVIKALQEPLIEAQIIDANTEQLWAGKTRDNQDIEPPYSEWTVAVKNTFGQPFDRVTLKDTGAFYKAFTVKWGPDKFELLSTDEKYDKLGEKYGFQIYGLSPEHLADIRVEVTPYLFDYARKALKIH